MKTTFLNNQIHIECSVQEAQNMYSFLTEMDDCFRASDNIVRKFLIEQLSAVLMKGTKDESK
jgi:hypothetical protein